MKHNKQLKATDKIFTQVGAKRRGRIICNEEFSLDNLFNELIASIRNDIVELEKIVQDLTDKIVCLSWYNVYEKLYYEAIQKEKNVIISQLEAQILACDNIKKQQTNWLRKIVEDDLKLSK